MSAKQAIDDKLQGTVATYLKCGGLINNQIKKGLLLSLLVKKKIKIGEYLAKLQLTSKNVIDVALMYHLYNAIRFAVSDS